MPRGSKPGERRGGRQKGAPNKVGQDVRELARSYTAACISALAEIVNTGKSEQARAMAADKLLDRGWGKAPQPIEAEVTHNFVARVPNVSASMEEWQKEHGDLIK